ncbi:hypothetical protein MTQ93_09615 [Staphylococcus agnetis]|uniref:hypothetical protein n=1 Tax=Staphylococcus agnetis TaxID=985762 RepID=UPI00208F40F6|nr:hypothetical protein [Staphylococcus agnetis]MCO4346301.1 hypothetical protein [Staphylococcus agnetis]MCO4360623.1 hypothetical protein [Staphylococcus agnetis]
MAEENKKRYSEDIQRYSFMVNILAGRNKQTMKVGWLGFFTSDPSIPYIRLGIGLGVSIVTSLFMFWWITHNAAMTKYIALQSVTLWLCILGLCLMYILPDKRNSLLYSGFSYRMYRYLESYRRKGKSARDLVSLGIKDFDSSKGGLCILEPPSEFETLYAYIYEIEGYASKSTLPSVFNSSAQARLDYLKVRDERTHQKMITTVKEADVSQQLKSIEKRQAEIRENENIDIDTKEWIDYMLSINHRYITKISEGERTSSQLMMLIVEGDTDDLENESRKWEAHASNSYARFRKITTRKEAVHLLRKTTSLSTEGVRHFEKETISTQEEPKRY